VPLVGERFALKDAHRGEQSPSIEEPCLAGRKARLVDGNNPVIMKNQPMDQMDLVHSLPQSAPIF
jgi:hypothetical protein